MPSHPKTLTNRRNARRSTGPTSTEGKLASSQNSRKHGLNIEIDLESSCAYVSLKSLLIKEGYSSFVAADIAAWLLNYRRVMDAYYEAYSRSIPVNESIWNMDLEGLPLALGEISKGTAADNRSMARLFGRLQRNERRQGGPVSRRTVDIHKLIRYQRHAISRFSKAIRPA